MGKKHSTKRGEAQRKRKHKGQHKRGRALRVDYFRVPKPLWKRIKHLLPEQPRAGGRGRPAIGNRAVLNAIWYVLWTGCQWKALPQRTFGVSGSVAHQRFQLWR